MEIKGKFKKVYGRRRLIVHRNEKRFSLPKGELILKANCKAVNSSKNEQMNLFLLLHVRCLVFGRN